MKTMSRLIKLVQTFEVFSPSFLIEKNTQDLTIGYCHRVKVSEVVRFKFGISESQAKELFKVDLLAIKEKLKPYLLENRINLPDRQLLVLASLVRDVGFKTFKNSKMPHHLKHGNFNGVLAEFLSFEFCDETNIKKRQIEKLLYEKEDLKDITINNR